MKSFKDLREKTLTPTAKKVNEVSTDKLRDYASAALQDKNKAKADKRWKYAGKAMQKVADRDVKAKHDLKYNKTEAVEEKTLTPAEKKKREEIAKAMERDNPGMDMKKKMAIATATAKRVAEESDDRDELTKKLFPKKSPKEMEKTDKERNRKMNQKRFMKPGKPSRSREWGVYEEVELEEGIENMSHARLKWHMNTGVPHGSYTKAEMKAERDRRLSKVDTHAAYKKAKPSMNEEADSSMCCKHCGDEFGKPTNEKCTYDAYDPKGKNWVKKESYNEAKVDEISLSHLSNTIAKSTGTKNIKTAMKPGEVKKGLDDLKKRLATLGQDPKMVKEAYRVHAVSKDGEKMKSGLHPTKKAASDMHYKMAKSGMYKKIEVVKETVELDEAETTYVIKHKKTKQVLSTHSNYNDAKDEHSGISDKQNYGIFKQTKKDAALRNRNTYREEAQLDEISKKTLGSYVKKASANIASTSADNARDYATGNRPVGINKKGVKIMKRTKYVNKAVDKLTQEEVQSADKKPEKYIKPDGKVGIRMVRTDKKVVDKDA
jgi:hypothetical protein